MQFSEPDPVPPGDIETFVAELIGRALTTTKSRPVAGKAWLFFLATERHHPTGLHCWIGVGAGVPAKVVNAVQAGLEARACRSSREHAVIAHHALRPLLALTTDSVEVPIGATSPDDSTLALLAEQVDRKPFVVGLKELLKKDLLGAIFLGEERPFHLRYFQDDTLATLSFGRVDLQVFARHRDGSYTAMTRYTTTPPCVVSFDFLEPQLAELIALLPVATAEVLVGALMQGRPVRVPPGSIVVGSHARPAPPDGSGSTSFVVEKFTPESSPDLFACF